MLNATEDNPSLGIPALSTHQSDLRPLTKAWNHAVLVHRNPWSQVNGLTTESKISVMR